MRAPWTAALLVAVTLLSAGARAAGEPIAGRTQGYIAALTMDGDIVAYGIEGALQGPACARVATWNVRTGSRAVVSGPRTCGAGDTSTGAGLAEIAVAGARVAWLVNLGGNSESIDELYATSLSEPKERLISRARRVGDVDCALEGREIGGLAGDARLLAVNTWSVAAAEPGSCGTRMTGVALRTVGRTSTTTIARGPGTWLAQAADRGRFAVRRADGHVAIYSGGGRLLREVGPTSAAEVALQGRYLVVLTGRGSLEVFDAGSGARLSRRGVERGARHLDVHAGIAVVAVGRLVRAVDLASGRSAVVATAPRAVVDLALEAPGAVYAYNSLYTTASGEVGNVSFLSLERIRRALA